MPKRRRPRPSAISSGGRYLVSRTPTAATCNSIALEQVPLGPRRGCFTCFRGVLFAFAVLARDPRKHGTRPSFPFSIHRRLHYGLDLRKIILMLNRVLSPTN